MAKGIDWAISNNIKVLNMSFGGPTESKTVERLIKKAYSHGMVLVASVGNDGNGSPVSYPAKYSNVIGVAATDNLDQLTTFSNTGAEVELVAPGLDIFSTYLSGTYIGMSGTSMAAPHVSGVAALVWSKTPTLTNIQVRQKLKDGAIDLGAPGVDDNFGYGLVSAIGSLK